MFNAQELRSEITRLLTKAREENAALQQRCVEFPSDNSEIGSMLVHVENMYTIRRRLRELVGDDIATAMIAEELGTDMSPPKLPKDYVPLSLPLPLIGKNDDLWVVLADHGDLGLLIYEERFCRVFLVAEECITLLYTLMENAQKFFDLCTPEYLKNPVHQSGLAMIRNWLSQKTESE